jgi:predicted metal-dependent phosphoesterase TrpH
VRIDLHLHSTASDGTDRPAQVMGHAHAAGVDVVALTDHDTVAGLPDAAAALPPGLTLVPGIELSCLLGSHSLHLLGYLCDPADPGLAAVCTKITASRLDRAEAMVARLRALGVPVTWQQVTDIAAGGTVGRPHVARAMVAAGVIGRFEQAFTKQWIAPGGRAYVSRYAPAPADAIGVVRGAGGVAVLAHPRAGRRGWRLPAGQLARLAAVGLAGVEVDHPDHDPAQRAELRVLAGELDLLVLGSSDDHGSLTGRRIGCETTAPAMYERLVSLATGTQPIEALRQ